MDCYLALYIRYSMCQQKLSVSFIQSLSAAYGQRQSTCFFTQLYLTICKTNSLNILLLHMSVLLYFIFYNIQNSKQLDLNNEHNYF